MQTPSKDKFKLSKAKLIKDGGLACTYEVEEVIGQETYNNKYNSESPKLEHPDLKNCFRKLVYIIARIYHLTFFKTLMETQEFAATRGQVDVANKAFDEVMDKVEVTGIALSGEEDNVGVIITGTFLADTNQKMSINTHRIRLEGDHYGFEQDLTDIVSEIEEEVYAYLFEDKQAQLQLFNASGQPIEQVKGGLFEKGDDEPSEDF